MATDGDRRSELAKFLRSRRERISPDEVGLPTGPRRRTLGLRREEVAVLAGLSPTWYTYLEQGRGIQPSREVLDSLARVLRLTEDERRYLHGLAHNGAAHATPLDTTIDPADLLKQLVAQFEDSPHPVYACDHRCDVLVWNPAACEWYDDWGAMPPRERNLLRWLLVSPVAHERIVDWEDVAKDAIARWRPECARYPDDAGIRHRLAEFRRINPLFTDWWESHDVLEHRAGVRRFRHGQLGVQAMRIIPLQAPELVPPGIVVHIPLISGDLPE